MHTFTISGKPAEMLRWLEGTTFSDDIRTQVSINGKPVKDALGSMVTFGARLNPDGTVDIVDEEYTFACRDIELLVQIRMMLPSTIPV